MLVLNRLLYINYIDCLSIAYCFFSEGPSADGPSDGRPRGHRTWGGVGPGSGPAHEGIDSYAA